jgi:hypothetical protein
LIELQVKHQASLSVTNTIMVGVVKDPAPAKSGTWNTVNANPPLKAKQATTHTLHDVYFVTAIGSNATSGRFTPSAEDNIGIFID